MIFIETALPGVLIVQPERIEDERGFFARTWCAREFAARNLAPGFVQCATSLNIHKGTLRGMHYQAAPHTEAKLVRCTSGTIYDVALDLRCDSPTYRQWSAAVLTAENRRMLYIPPGCAHGYLTLEEQSEVFYQISAFYAPEAARGVRWDDPAFQIAWPAQVRHISERDRNWELHN